MFIDTHCHINIMTKNSFESALSNADFQIAHDIITLAEKNNVKKIFNIGTSIIESKNCLLLAEKFPSVFAAIAIHPNDLSADWKKDMQDLKNLYMHAGAVKDKIIGIGECGLDYHYPDYDKQKQQDAFKAHIEFALEKNLAVIVHTRDAGEDTLRCLEQFASPQLRGTIHCFSEDLPFAQQAIEMGFVLGIGGTITYPKNNSLREVVQAVGIDNIILETDAPYLAPQVVRGKQNTPSNIPLIAEYIGQLLQIPIEEVERRTTNQVARIFAPQFIL